MSDADEDFLDACLDDRSGRVREAAAGLLSRLSNSKLVARMIARLEPLVTFIPGSPSSLLKLKRGSKPRIDLNLPAAFDKSMQRDGISEKPSDSLGPKQWWLLQMISCVPLDHWTQKLNASPEALIESIPKEFESVFVAAG